jgi:hypothetical protein
LAGKLFEKSFPPAFQKLFLLPPPSEAEIFSYFSGSGLAAI